MPKFYLQNAKFGHLFIRKKSLNCCHQMSDFKDKMHQMQYRLGLRLQTHWWSSQRSPDHVAGSRDPTSKEKGKGKGREEK